jgi:hypothetical protein
MFFHRRGGKAAEHQLAVDGQRRPASADFFEAHGELRR